MELRKVFVLTGYFNYEGGTVLGVYTCRCEAMLEKKRLYSSPNGKAGCKYDGYLVEEFTLIEGRQ